ncbi:LysR family transcriptional regulator [Nocardia sp. NPDC058666]|uniref:LysR family transcriptional regulator n=1 Tax=Nocardia sp. NPDC058666 TaxID=3346587 RepID=UPI00366383C0
MRELRYFVAVAEHSTFSGAAAALGMAQPPLSRAIRLLERRLGVDLFVRSAQGVTLTDAGQTLLDESFHALAAIGAAAARTRRAGLTQSTLIATAKPGTASGLLRRAVDAFTETHRSPVVEILVAGYRGQTSMVRDGRADVAIVGSPFDSRGLAVEVLSEEPRVAVVATDHRLATRRDLRCRELLGETIPVFPDATQDERLYWSGRDRVGAGSPLEVATSVEISTTDVGDITQVIELVALGHAVALLPRSVANAYPRADVVHLPTVDASPYVSSIVWPQGSRSRSLAEFVRFTVEFAGQEQAQLHRGAS